MRRIVDYACVWERPSLDLFHARIRVMSVVAWRLEEDTCVAWPLDCGACKGTRLFWSCRRLDPSGELQVPWSIWRAADALIHLEGGNDLDFGACDGRPLPIGRDCKIPTMEQRERRPLWVESADMSRIEARLSPAAAAWQEHSRKWRPQALLQDWAIASAA